MTAAARPEVPLEIPTERLTLRAPHPDYAQEMNDGIRESIAELREWMDWAQQIPTLEESRDRQTRARRAFLAKDDLQLFHWCLSVLVDSGGAPAGP